MPVHSKTWGLILLTIATLNIQFHCRYDGPVRPFDYTFEIPVDILPLKKVYTTNDTIWLQLDVTGKLLFDTKTSQAINADTTMIIVASTYAEFGTNTRNPQNGLAQVITEPGVIAERQTGFGYTSATVSNYGCGKPTFKIKIGFKPNYPGTFSLNLRKDLMLQGCMGKVIPVYSTYWYKFKQVDLNGEILNTLSGNDLGGNSNRSVLQESIAKREMFVFTVQ